MNEISNYAMYAVEKKVEGEYKRNRMLMVLLYILFPVLLLLFFGIIALFGIDLSFFGILFIPIYVFLLPKVIKPLTWRWVDITYRYEISMGNFTVATIYGEGDESYAWKNFEVKVRDLLRIEPYTEEMKKELSKEKFEKVYEATSSMSNPDTYFATFYDENERYCVVYFEVTEKVLKVLKFLNKNTVVKQVSK